MADSKISALTTKTTFGDDDFLAGTQGTEATDNRKYGKEALQNAVATTVPKLWILGISGGAPFVDFFKSSNFGTSSASGASGVISISNNFSTVTLIAGNYFQSSSGIGYYFAQEPTGSSSQSITCRRLSDDSVIEDWGGMLLLTRP